MVETVRDFTYLHLLSRLFSVAVGPYRRWSFVAVVLRRRCFLLSLPPLVPANKQLLPKPGRTQDAMTGGSLASARVCVRILLPGSYLVQAPID